MIQLDIAKVEKKDLYGYWKSPRILRGLKELKKKTQKKHHYGHSQYARKKTVMGRSSKAPNSPPAFSSHLSASLSFPCVSKLFYLFPDLSGRKHDPSVYTFFHQPKLRLESLGLHSKLPRKDSARLS